MTPNRIATLAATAAVAAGAIAFARVVDAAQAKYVMVDELVADPVYDRELKVHGWIVAGTIHHDGLGDSFELQRDGKRVTVKGQLLTSACLRDQSEVIVLGQLQPGLVIDATDIECKCAERYDWRPPSSRNKYE